jgi:hypothetical protein
MVDKAEALVRLIGPWGTLGTSCKAG